MEEKQDMFESRIDLTDLHLGITEVEKEISKVIVGQPRLIRLMIAAILANGHVLIEGVPGIAKTLSAKLLSKSLSVGFSRIQFTPDLMPSDVVGTTIFNMEKSEFNFKQGPVFSNIILIDEINRAPAKTQSALFEVMEERQITVDGTTYPMEEPFLVFATQNPIEHEGTYKLPEAQLDRFLFKIEIDYPSVEEEAEIMMRSHKRENQNELEEINPVLDAGQIAGFQNKVKQVHIDEKLVNYIAQITDKTRKTNSIYLGGSPRASLNMMICSKAFAAMAGRDFVTPDDIKEAAEPVLIHRIQLTPEKEMEGMSPREVIKFILNSIEIPR